MSGEEEKEAHVTSTLFLSTPFFFPLEAITSVTAQICQISLVNFLGF